MLRWLLRFSGWLLSITALGIVVVGLLAATLYWNRARVLENSLEFLAKPFEVEVGKVHLFPLGQIRVEDLRLTPRRIDSDGKMLTVPELVLTYDFADLQSNRKVRSLLLKEPELVLTDPMISGLGQEGGAPREAFEFDLRSLGFFTESVKVESGHFRLESGELPPVVANWDLTVPALDFDEDGVLRNPIDLSLSDVRVELPSEPTSARSILLRGRANQDLSSIEILDLRLEGLDLTLTPEWISPKKKNAASAPTERPSLPELALRSLSLGESRFRISGFDGSDEQVAIPETEFDASASFSGISYREGSWTSESSLSLELRNVAIGSIAAQLASADQVSIELESLETLLREHRFARLELQGIDVVLSDEGLARCRENAHREPDNPPDSVAQDDPPKAWVFDEVEVGGGTFLMKDLTLDGKESVRLETRVDGRLRDLRFGGEDGFASEGIQEVQLADTRLWAPGVTVGNLSLLHLKAAEGTVDWRKFDFNNRIESLRVSGAEINFTDEALGAWLKPDGPERATGPENRPVYKVADLDIREGTLVADSQFASGRVPKITAQFSMTNDPDEETDPFAYLLQFMDLELRNHSIITDQDSAPAASPIAEEQVFTVREIDVRSTAEMLQRDREVGEVTLRGAVLRVGNGLKALVGTDEEEADATPDPDPAQAAGDPNLAAVPTWTLKRVKVTESQVQFESLLPEIEGLNFAIETTLTDVPLSPAGILAQEKIQQVELAGLEIRDPYDSFIPVAMLPTIFVKFSLAGLARQEIEKIDLITPSLFVGQGLFWWVDYQRNFRAQNEGTSFGVPDGEAEDVEPEESSPTNWVIKEIEATSGKIVIAPTGIPIGVVPFPFNASTNLKDGRIELKLEIPDEESSVYEFPNYKVELYGLEGDVLFNVPVQQVDNNLYQQFRLDRLRWKDYEAQNVFLEVTFDADGVYGKVEGDAYGGYVNGAFNFYLNDPGKWDAWITGSRLESKPLTDVLAPQNFRMEGPVYLVLVTEGRDKTLGETTGEVETLAPGWFDITKLDELLARLPDDWSQLQTGLAEIGIEALKRFEYDKGAGSLTFQGREGDLDLRFTGPYGSRTFHLQLHDTRSEKQTKLTATPATGEGETTENPREPAPTAAARPVPEAAARPIATAVRD